MILGSFSLALDFAGLVETVYFDSAGIFTGMPAEYRLWDLFGSKYRRQIEQFISDVQEKISSTGLEMLTDQNGQEKQFYLTGSQYNDRILVMGVAAHPEVSEMYFQEIMRINNEQANMLRSMIKAVALKPSPVEYDQNLSEFTELNNQLMGFQRKLTKQNADMERQLAQISMLNQMNAELQRSETFEQTLDVIVQASNRLYENSGGRLYLFRADIQQFELRKEWGHPNREDLHSLSTVEEKLMEVFTGAGSLADIQAYIEHNLPKDCLFLAIPGMDEMVGILQIFIYQNMNMRDPFRLQYQEAFLKSVGLAISNMRYREWLRRDSIIDHLTGLYNRRFLENELEREISRATRQRSVFTIVMIDLDKFKQVNDTFGHQTGDELLRNFSALLQKEIRKEDHACRLGGDEFVLLLPEANEDEARLIMQRIQKGCGIVSLQMNNIALEFSYGLASYPSYGSDAEDLLKVADEKLYEMKHQH